MTSTTHDYPSLRDITRIIDDDMPGVLEFWSLEAMLEKTEPDSERHPSSKEPLSTEHTRPIMTGGG